MEIEEQPIKSNSADSIDLKHINIFFAQMSKF